MYALSHRVAGRIVGLVYILDVVENALRFSPTKNSREFSCLQRVACNYLTPTQISVGIWVSFVLTGPAGLSALGKIASVNR
jgi:hypothetical protein